MFPTRILARLAVLPTFLFSLASANAADGDVHVRVLDNGLKVVIKEDHRSPVAVNMVWYRAGSMDEFNGTTGVAHVLEHMMFKGTRNVPVGEFSKIVARAGGRDNAFTSHDYTAYHQQVHKSKLDLVIGLEADRMANLNLSDEEFAKEIKVVQEERRMRTDDNPRSLLHEQIMAAVYIAHPYRAPIIGWMNDLENLRAADARAWYQQWYAPNNAVVVICGDVNPQETFALVERHFAGIKAKLLPDRKPQQEPAQTGVRRVTVKAPAELPYLLLGYHVPALRDVERDWEPYALEVLSGVLDGNDAARLNQLVRTERLAISAGASYSGISRGPAQFWLEGVPAQGKSVAELEVALKRELARIVSDSVTDEELNRVKAQVIAQQVYQRDSVFYQAMQIGMLETVGLPNDTPAREVQKIREVTAEQVREVATKYFSDDNLTVGTLDPQPLAHARAATPPAGARPH
jgi:zinc protease